MGIYILRIIHALIHLTYNHPLHRFIPFALSFVWFNPKTFGGEKWNEIAGISEEKSKRVVKPWKGFITIIFNFLIAFGLFALCVHQNGVFSLVGGNAELLKSGVGAEFLAVYGQNHLTFGHGALHGFLATLCFFVPMLVYVVFFEHKSAKYFWVYFSYWAVSLMLMGGILGQWGAVAV